MNFLHHFFSLLRPRPQNRFYSSYEDYLKHQAEKTLDPQRRELWLGTEWEEKYQAFLRLFQGYSFVQPHLSAVCLGARTGQEVKALRDLGLDTRGFDLVPCPPYVEKGDIHHLDVPAASADFIFSNIFDHCFDPKLFIAEIERILKPGGHAVLLLQIGKAIRDESYDVVYVGNSAEVLKLFKSSKIVLDRKIAACLGMNWEIAVRKN